MDFMDNFKQVKEKDTACKIHYHTYINGLKNLTQNLKKLIQKLHAKTFQKNINNT